MISAEIIIGTLALLVSLVNLRVIWKLRRQVARLPFEELLTRNEFFGATSTNSAHQFQQFQALERLTFELDLRLPLPPMRGWAASPDFPLLAFRQARQRRPDVIVECGSGASTVVMARAVQLNGQGRVMTIEHDGGFAQKTRELLEEYGLSNHAEVIHAPLVTDATDGEPHSWYGFEPPDDLRIDLLIVDGPPEGPDTLARYPAGPRLVPKLNPGGIAMVDDAHRPNEQTAIRRWLAELPGLGVEFHDLEKGCAIITKAVEPS